MLYTFLVLEDMSICLPVWTYKQAPYGHMLRPDSRMHFYIYECNCHFLALVLVLLLSTDEVIRPGISVLFKEYYSKSFLLF